MATTRQALREKIVDRLYSGYEIVLSTTSTTGSTSTLTDSALIQGMFEENDYIGAYIYFSGGSTDSAADTNEAPFSVGDTTLTVDDGSKFTDGDLETILIESELLSITAVAGNNLTVIRGFRGTTDAEHATNTDIYFSEDMQSSQIVAFDRTAGTFTISPAVTVATGTGTTYEIHYDLHPERVIEAIKWAIEAGTNGSLSTPGTDAGTTTLEAEVVVEGALAYCKRAIANQTSSRDPAPIKSEEDKLDFLQQAIEHEANWLEGCKICGFNPWVADESLFEVAQQ